MFNNLNGNGDVIEPGAFKKTLANARETKAQIHSPFLYPLLWQHDETEPIGGITDAAEDANGLYIAGQYDLDVPRGQQVYRGAKMSYLTGLSIGYRTVKSVVGLDRARHLLEIELFEGSPVTFPANTQAQITSVKARSIRQSAASYADDGDSDEELARKLEYQAAVMVLESKAASLRHSIGDAELANRTKGFQARVQGELRAMRERHSLERKARKRGERVPDLQADPEAYVSRLRGQRALPYVELARDLDAQSRHSGGGLR